MSIHIGLDLGGTKIEIVVIDDKYKILYRKRVPTQSEKGSDHVLDRIDYLYKKATQLFKNKKHTIGIGTPGSISQKNGLLRNSTIYCQNGLPLLNLIENKLQHSVVIENDANCFALAEAKIGAGKSYRLVFGIILGTGCGGGFVLDNKLWSGFHGLAGEWGHSTIDMDGPKCFCGKRGCINTFISGTGLENILFNGIKKKKTAEYFLNQKKYSMIEQEILDEFYNNFGKAIVNIINIIDPNVIVVGGGLSNNDDLYTKGIKRVIENSLNNDEGITPIKRNALGDSAGVLGAALLPFQEK
ncbi:MAG: ROK family protein [Pelagibacteraceae bacterium]|jgi:fructokinase|nr:ROK family protein [Pelagibacteraceae bacterium]